MPRSLWDAFALLVLLSFLRSSTCDDSGALDGSEAHQPFVVIWNALTQSCEPKYGISVNVTGYGIRSNIKNGWSGEQITIAGSNLGTYPSLTENGTVVNGGVPQMANLTAHIEKLLDDIVNAYGESSANDAMCIIDWESWRPSWERNYDALYKYQEKSIKLVQKQHPKWTHAEIVAEAKRQFENGARLLMLETLQVARILRPKCHWGYYGFPHCIDSTSASGNCTQHEMALNDELYWLFNGSTVLLPSIYFYQEDREINRRFVHVEVSEALRLKRLLFAAKNTIPIFPYTRIRFNDNNDLLFYAKEDLEISLQLPAFLGADGAIIWDDNYLEMNAESCQKTKTFVDEVLGPFVVNLHALTRRCSVVLCHSQGKCVLNNSMETNKQGSSNNFDFLSDFASCSAKSNCFQYFMCSCNQGWSGKFCERSLEERTLTYRPKLVNGSKSVMRWSGSALFLWRIL